MTLRIAVLISGTGSNFAALAKAIDAGNCNAEIVGVFSDRPAAAGLTLAQSRGLPTHVVSPKDHADRSGWDVALADAVATVTPDLVVLAGFMRVVGAPLLQRFPRRVINVHPSLLPLFPGTRGPEQALEAGVRVTGCTVHVVDQGVDTGPIIAQAVVRVLPDDTPDTLHARIQGAEHRLLPRVVAAIARGTVTLDPAVQLCSVVDDGQWLCSPALDEAKAS
jgi:phosphoribosylglycinamide formyltransferase 1